MNYALEYNALSIRVKDKIDEIKEFGIDVSEWTNEYNEIINSASKNIRNTVSNSVAAEGLLLESAYTESIKNLQKLETSIDKYNSYYKMYYNCKMIDKKTIKEMTAQELETYINVLKDYIKKLNISHVTDYKYISFVFDKVYDTCYKIIKFEIIKNNSSSLLKYINLYENAKQKIEGMIKEEISSLDLTKYDVIEEKLYEIRSKGLDNDLLDEEIIFLLIMISDKSILENNIIEEQENLTKQRTELKESMQKKVDRQRSVENSINYETAQKQKGLKELGKKLILFLVSGLTIFGIGKFCIKGTKKLTTSTLYRQYEVTYDSYDDKATTIDLGYGKEYENVTIEVYYPAEEGLFNAKREVREYSSLSEYDFENPKDYMNINLDDLYYETSRLTVDELTERINETYKIITMIKNDENDFIKTENKEGYYGLLTCEFAILLCLIIAFLKLGDPFQIVKTKWLIDDLKDALEKLKSLKLEDEKLEKEIKELKKLDEEICKKILELDKKCHLLDRNKNKPYVRTKKANV